MRQFPPDTTFRIHFFMHSVPFTAGVLSKATSLGGSESACRVLAEALAARGHDVHIFATQLLPDVAQAVDNPAAAADMKRAILQDICDKTGVMWHDASDLPDVLKFEQPDVFVSLRMTDIFRQNIPAKCRMLWAQDLLIDASQLAQLHAVDRILFVSQYHREQWCTPPASDTPPPPKPFTNGHDALRPLALVTKNPIDLRDRTVIRDITDESGSVTAQTTDTVLNLRKTPNRFIHVSRPERGIDGVIALWPKIRERIPDATLRVCRYSSMYDAGGWGEVCKQYDAKLQATHAKYGGIEFLGELNKKQLYSEIAQAAAMLYPTTQPNFAETNCIAASEAQACGTPIIATARGALPETVAKDAGILIEGDVLNDAAVQQQFVEACAELGPAVGHAYKAMRAAGLHQAERVDGPVVAEEFEQTIRTFFEQRYDANKPAVLRQLLHWDNHAPAIGVCEDIVDGFAPDGPPETWPEHYREACAARGLIHRVIQQEEQTAEDYSTFAIQHTEDEMQGNGRLHVAAQAILEHIKDIAHPLVLDVACGNGSLAMLILQKHPGARVLGVDYSHGVLDLARGAAFRLKVADRCEFRQLDIMNNLHKLAEVQADAVFCGEFLEHVEKPWVLIDALEAAGLPGARVVLTTPCGPFAELLPAGVPRKRGHVHAFSLRDIAHMYESKREYAWQYLSASISRRGTPCGYWVMTFIADRDSKPAQVLDYNHTILTERPYTRVVAMMIVKNEVGWLHQCLASLDGVVDKVVVYDTGSTDGSIELCEGMGAEVTRGEWPDHFGEARNRALALAEPQAEYVLWIDADERLEGGHALRYYATDGGAFAGFVVRQCHLQLDGPNYYDRPVRLFRTGRGVRFYGDVHEQPENAPDAGISPALDQEDVKIVHLGYQTGPTRRHKMLQRNLRLLMRAIKSGACRELDYVLYTRDLMNTAMFDMEATGGRLTKKAYVHVMQAIKVYDDKGFGNPAHRSHTIAWPYYQQALKVLGNGIEVNFGFLAARGSLEGRTAPGETFLVRSTAEAKRLIDHKLTTWFRQMDGPRIVTTPYAWIATTAREALQTSA